MLETSVKAKTLPLLWNGKLGEGVLHTVPKKNEKEDFLDKNQSIYSLEKNSKITGILLVHERNKKKCRTVPKPPNIV